MLQRAASNAYSWWWVSHIRTKQSTWMDQNLQDMEEKVQGVLKLLEEEGDSFAKRAEMYYKRRPELISFVEESFKAYRALAERYDHISTELQNANNTIASVFPDRVPFMDDEDDGSPRPQRKKPEGFKTNIPKPPLKDLKTVVTTAAATRKFLPKKSSAIAAAVSPKVLKSGLSRKEALEEVEKLQKQILALQTVKEFVKNSYDNAVNKYQETEEEINELQDRVSIMQEELGEGVVIEDDDARHLMAEAALKSCQEALTKLQEKQERSLDETRTESKRIEDVKAKLGSLMDEFHYDQSNSKEPRVQRDLKEIVETEVLQENTDGLTQQKKELLSLKENIKANFETSSNSSLSVPEMAEKINELVNKVIGLENAVSTQTAMVKRLSTETDELQDQIRTLENDKESLIKDKNKLNDQLREMEEKLHGLQDLNQIVEVQNCNLQTQFTETHSDLDHLSEEVQNVQPGEEAKITDLSHTSTHAESKCESEEQIPMNKDNIISNDIKSEKELTAGSVEDDATDKELKAAGTVEDNVTSNNTLEVTGLPFTNEPNVTSSLENDAKSVNEVKAISSLEMEEATPVENKSPRESKEQDKTVNPGNGDDKATVAVITTTENHEVSPHPASNRADDNSSESFDNRQENDTKQSSSVIENALKDDPKGQATKQEDEPDWQQLFTKGMQDREQVLLNEYTNTLRNYKDVKKRLAEIEKKNQDSNFDSSLQLKELKTVNAMKDEEIKLLRQKLGLLQRSLEGNEELTEATWDIGELIKTEPESISSIEEKFRLNMDEILEENLNFWLKFSAHYSETQKFENTIRDLQTELSKLHEKEKLSDSSNIKYSIKSDAKPIYKHLTEIQSEMTLWMEKGGLLKEELQRKFSSLCDIQEEITTALKASAEDDDFRFTSYQAAKFQGEILNMKQENNKVADELQAGLDIATSLHLEVEKALVKLNDEFGLSTSKRQQNGQLRQSETRAKVPLRSFIFGTKPKKQSIFSCMTPTMHKKHRSSQGQSHM